MLRDRLQTQDLFLRGTKSKCAYVVESTRHVTALSIQVPKTIQFTNALLRLFREQVSHEYYFLLPVLLASHLEI